VRGEASEAELAELPGLDGRGDMDARLTLKATLEEVMRLPEEQRSVVLLVIVEGFSYRDAAEVLGVPIGTVMSRIARARLALEGKVFGEGRPPLSVVRQ
jgi:RNA polymerase sigma-70 factor (ECF subfamily)